MNMWKERKLYLKAIKALPDKFIDDDTRVATWDSERVIAANPKYNVMCYTEDTGWNDMVFDTGINSIKHKPCKLN